jgi:hypothetical protein
VSRLRPRAYEELPVVPVVVYIKDFRLLCLKFISLNDLKLVVPWESTEDYSISLFRIASIWKDVCFFQFIVVSACHLVRNHVVSYWQAQTLHLNGLSGPIYPSLFWARRSFQVLRGDDVLGFMVVNGEAGTWFAKLKSKNMGYGVSVDDVLEDPDFHRQLVSLARRQLSVRWDTVHNLNRSFVLT